MRAARSNTVFEIEILEERRGVIDCRVVGAGAAACFRDEAQCFARRSPITGFPARAFVPHNRALHETLEGELFDDDDRESRQ